MKIKVQELPLPDDLVISEVLLEEEKERVNMPNVYVKIASKPTWHREKQEGKIRATRKVVGKKKGKK
jgi:hypothetical protein